MGLPGDAVLLDLAEGGRVPAVRRRVQGARLVDYAMRPHPARAVNGDRANKDEPADFGPTRLRDQFAGPNYIAQEQARDASAQAGRDVKQDVTAEEGWPIGVWPLQTSGKRRETGGLLGWQFATERTQVAPGPHQTADFDPAIQKLTDQPPAEESGAPCYDRDHVLPLVAASKSDRQSKLASGENGVHDRRNPADLGVGDGRARSVSRGFVEPSKQGVHTCEVLQVAADKLPGVSRQVLKRLARLTKRNVQL